MIEGIIVLCLAAFLSFTTYTSPSELLLDNFPVGELTKVEITRQSSLGSGVEKLVFKRVRDDTWEIDLLSIDRGDSRTKHATVDRRGLAELIKTLENAALQRVSATSAESIRLQSEKFGLTTPSVVLSTTARSLNSVVFKIGARNDYLDKYYLRIATQDMGSDAIGLISSEVIRALSRPLEDFSSAFEVQAQADKFAGESPPIHGASME